MIAAIDLPNVFCFMDATYLYCYKPSTPRMNALLWCHYKNRYCVKVMVICAPNGKLLSVWGPYPGSWSDDKIFKKVLSEAKTASSDFWKWLLAMPPGATIGVDAGFPSIHEVLPPHINIISPPKLRNGEEVFPTDQVIISRHITRWRGVSMYIIIRRKIFVKGNYADIRTSLRIMQKRIYRRLMLANHIQNQYQTTCLLHQVYRMIIIMMI